MNGKVVNRLENKWNELSKTRTLNGELATLVQPKMVLVKWYSTGCKPHLFFSLYAFFIISGKFPIDIQISLSPAP